MEWNRFFLECILALAGGCLGAAVSALGAFLLFGLSGIVGFAYLLVAGQDTWIVSIAAGVLLKPSVCFLGGLIAAAYTRKKKLIECGKDIGRSLLSFHRFDILLVGSLAGLAGYLLNNGLDRLLSGKIDTIALTVFIVPVIAKYLWRLTKTNDCEASSHAVPSPYRFFDKLSKTSGKIALSVVVGLCTALIAWLLTLNRSTSAYAPLFMFSVSAFSLSLVYMGIPVPATHHYSATAGAVVVLWLSLNGGAANGLSIVTMALWGVAAAQFALLSSDVMGKLFFDQGDIHVDPPAMGILVTSGLFLGLLPLTGVYNIRDALQWVLCAAIICSCVLLSLTLVKKPTKA